MFTYFLMILVGLNDVFSTYNPKFLPHLNRTNLELYCQSDDYGRHARSAKIYYNGNQMTEADALRVIYQREPTNIGMGKDQYNKEQLQQLFGYTSSVYNEARKEDGSLFSELPNTAAVYSETYLWNPPGGNVKKELACLSLPAPALDSTKQPHYGYYVSLGQLDGQKYESEMEFLFKCVEAALRDHLDSAFGNKGIQRLVLCKFGQGAFLGALSPADRALAQQIYKNEYSKFLTTIGDLDVEVFMCEYDIYCAHSSCVNLDRAKASGFNCFSEGCINSILPSEKQLNRESFRVGPNSHNLSGRSIVETAREGDLIVNAWDPHSAPGNGNDADHSFDGAMGKSSGILLTQTSWLNETLRSKDCLRSVE